MIDELKFLLLWFGTIELIGIACLPFTVWWSNRLFGQAVAASRLWGCLILGVVLWQFAYLKILPFTQPSIFFGLCVLIALNWSWYRKLVRIHTLPRLFNQYFFASWTFWLPFAVMLLIRGFNPNIHIYEKFMDMGILTSLIRTEWLPATDIWFAGSTINYYFFGHFIAALLTKLSSVPPEISYNFTIATIVGWISSLAFIFPATILWEITERKISAIKAGILSSLLVIGSGTLFTFSFLFTGEKSDYWYWSSIRLIPGAIHEMPSYSIFVADLHAHLLNIPHNLLIVAHLLSLYLLATGLHISRTEKIIRYLILGGLLGISTLTSIWDGPMYLGLSGLVVLFLIGQKLHWRNFLQESVVAAVTIGGSFLITFLPFFRHFDTSISEGVGRVTDFTQFSHLIILWGFPILIWLMGNWLLTTTHRRSLITDRWGIFQPLVLLIGVWSLVLLLVPELIYIKDIYGGDFYRGNTIFKFYYQAFILFSLLTATVLQAISVVPHTRILRLTKLVSLVIISCVLLYPFQIIPTYYNHFQQWQGWQGTQFLAEGNAADLEAIQWMNQHISGQPVVLESAGDSYTQDNRISVFTGLPTIQGWMTHEWLWRGGYEHPAKRTEEVAAIYQTANSAYRRELLKKYQVEYIYIGSLEAQKYPDLQLNALQSLGQTVFQNQAVQLIQLDTL